MNIYRERDRWLREMNDELSSLTYSKISISGGEIINYNKRYKENISMPK